jgi:hypothetical protein
MLQRFKVGYLFTFLLSLLLFVSGCGSPQIGLDATRMPDADLLGRADVVALRQGSFWKAVAEIAERNYEPGSGTWENPLETIQSILEAGDLSPDDLLEVRIAAALQSEEDRPLLVGFLLAGPLDLDQVQSALESAAEGTDVDTTFTRLDHPGGVILSLEGQAGEVKEQLHIGFADGGRVLFAGSPAVVDGAMNRSESRERSQIDEKLSGLEAIVSPDAHAFVAYIVAPGQREMIQEMMAGEIPVPHLAVLGNSLRTLEGVILEMQVHESLNLALNWTFMDGEDAGSFHSALQSTTDLLKGVVALATGGKPIDAINDLTLEREDSKVTLNLQVTENDLLTLEELYALNFGE